LEGTNTVSMAMSTPYDGNNDVDTLLPFSIAVKILDLACEILK
jgi:hypothetical protein